MVRLLKEDEELNDVLPVDEEVQNDGELYDLAKFLMVAYHSIAVLHHNLVGGAWFADHENLGDYYEYIGDMVDDIIEQNIELGGIEPSIVDAVNTYSPIEIKERN